MKKGLINLILLVLMITNVALTAILVFAVVPAMNSTTELVGKVAKAIDLEKELKDQKNETISIDKTATYTFSEKMPILLKTSDNGDQNFAQIQVTLTLNTEDEAYKKYEGKLSENENLMMIEVNRVLGGYTAEQLSDAEIKDQATKEIRDALRDLFNETEFIYSVGFSSFVIVPR
ncbi:MAG: flagellar basal body-associated FliL family protein [Lachnospiraceae bacterium]|jgi:flagellar basal body-associated protein FliL|nr:flagellar basal body-associated FliL family protein [Lachnospiraceae bacterium]